MRKLIVFVLAIMGWSAVVAEEQAWGYEGAIDRIISTGSFESFAFVDGKPTVVVGELFFKTDSESQQEIATATYYDCQYMDSSCMVIHLVDGVSGEKIGVVTPSGLHLN